MSKDATKDFFKKKKEWSVFKDALLGKYLRLYFAKIMQTRKGIFYIDCFAGKGKFDDGEPGSPLIATQLFDEARSRPTAWVPHLDKCVFIERYYADDLRRNLLSTTELDMEVIEGRYEDSIYSVLNQGKGQNLFLYFDPYGIKALDMDLFRKVGGLSNFHTTELLINFNSFGLFREGCRLIGFESGEECLDGLVEIDSSKVESISDMNRIMGGTYWQSIIGDYRKGKIDSYKAEQRITNEFCATLRQTYDYVINMPIRAKEGHNPKYRMIHATRHPSACVLMADNMYKRSVELRLNRRNGQFSLFEMGVDDSLFVESETKASLLECVSPCKKSLTEIQAMYYVSHGIDCQSTELFDYLDQLQSNGTVRITHDPQFTPTGRLSRSRSEKGKNKIYIERVKQ